MGKTHAWGPDELIAMEQKVLLRTASPLCLSPDPLVFETAYSRTYDAHKWNRQGLNKRSCKVATLQSAMIRSAAPVATNPATPKTSATPAVQEKEKEKEKEIEAADKEKEAEKEGETDEKQKEKKEKNRFICKAESHHEAYAKVLVVPTVVPASYALAKYLQARNIHFYLINFIF